MKGLRRVCLPLILAGSLILSGCNGSYRNSRVYQPTPQIAVQNLGTINGYTGTFDWRTGEVQIIDKNGNGITSTPIETSCQRYTDARLFENGKYLAAIQISCESPTGRITNTTGILR